MEKAISISLDFAYGLLRPQALLTVYIYIIYIYIYSKIQEQCSIRRPNLMATKMATLGAKAMAMAVAICRATWMEKTDGGKCNGNIGGKKTLANT